MNNNVLLKYLCVRENMPSELHQLRSRDTQFFVSEIIKKFGKKGLCSNVDGTIKKFTWIFSRVKEFEVKALKKLMRDVRCYFNKLCSQNPDKFYIQVPLIDWGKYNYQF